MFLALSRWLLVFLSNVFVVLYFGLMAILIVPFAVLALTVSLAIENSTIRRNQ